MAKQRPPYTVTCADGSEANGIAAIMQTLLRTNLANKPKLVKVARKMRHPVVVFSTDTETVCTLEFGAKDMTIRNGICGEPTVGLYVSADQLRDLSKLKMRGIVPTGLLGRSGRRIVKQLVTRQLVLKGLLSHPRASMRTLALVSLAD